MKLKHSEFVICNTTPLLYLHQLGLLWIIPAICKNILVPPAVVMELNAGREQGVNVPDASEYSWNSHRVVLFSNTAGIMRQLNL